MRSHFVHQEHDFALSPISGNSGLHLFWLLAEKSRVDSLTFFEDLKYTSSSEQKKHSISFLLSIFQPRHLKVHQLLLCDFVHQEQDFAPPYVTGGNSGLHILQLLTEESGVDSFTFSEDL